MITESSSVFYSRSITLCLFSVILTADLPFIDFSINNNNKEQPIPDTGCDPHRPHSNLEGVLRNSVESSFCEITKSLFVISQTSMSPSD